MYPEQGRKPQMTMVTVLVMFQVVVLTVVGRYSSAVAGHP